MVHLAGEATTVAMRGQWHSLASTCILVCRCLDIGRAINARLRRAEDEGKPPFRVLRECLSLRISSRVARLALVTESDTVPLMESSHRGGRGGGSIKIAK